MRRRFPLLHAVLAGALVLAACGDDPAEPAEATLTAEESMEVFNEILSALYEVGAIDGTSEALTAGGPAGEIARAAEAFDESAPCEDGGTIRVHGSVTDEGDETGGSLTYTFTQTPNGCGITTASGAAYMVDGDPSLTMSGSMAWNEEGPVGPFTMDFTGGLRWQGGPEGARGTCSVNMSYEMNWETFTGSVTGSMCGHTIDESL